MATFMETVDLALSEVDRLRKLLKKSGTSQVRSDDERSIVKATALAWFNSHRAILISFDGSQSFQDADGAYKRLLEASGRATSRSSYGNTLKALREVLIALRSESAAQRAATTSTSDQPPSFAPLIADTVMQGILVERWRECVRCISAHAPLSATVMMGGLLEALLLSRVNRETNKAPVFQATSAPKDKGGQTKPLSDWTLKHYIDVAHELGWISVSAKDVGQVLRDYRNYVHPFKQLSHGVNLGPEDAALLWEVSKAVTRQVLNSA